MRYSRFLIRCLLLVLSLSLSILGQLTTNRDGKLDRSFGNGGFALLHPDLRVDAFGDTLLLSDGTVFQVHTSRITPINILATKQLPNGVPDASFGQNGLKFIQLQGAGFVRSLALQPDGKLLVAGFSHTTSEYENNDFLVFRLSADGTLDPAFGSGGVVTMDFAPSGTALVSNDRASTILVQPDGKIIVTGMIDQFTVSPGRTVAYSLLVRLNSNGLIDESFGAMGVSKEILGNNDTNLAESGLTASFQKDGKILVCAVVNREDPVSPGQYSSRAFVLRYQSDGTLDPGFSDDGMIDITGPSPPGFCSAKEMSDGRILSLMSYGLVRLNPDGTIDPTFGNSGRASLGPGGMLVDFDVAPDNKIYVNRQAGRDGNRTIGQIRKLWPDGTPDIRFGNRGKTEFDLGAQNLFIGRITVFQDKYLIITGAIDLPPNFKPFVARFFATRKL